VAFKTVIDGAACKVFMYHSSHKYNALPVCDLGFHVAVES
jgi:hypothetical protein